MSHRYLIEKILLVRDPKREYNCDSYTKPEGVLLDWEWEHRYKVVTRAAIDHACNQKQGLAQLIILADCLEYCEACCGTEVAREKTKWWARHLVEQPGDEEMASHF